MLSPIAVQDLLGCVNIIGMLPAVFDLLFVFKLLKLSRLHRNLTKLVDVIAKVGNLMHVVEVEI